MELDSKHVGRRNIKLDQVKFIVMGQLSRDPEFNVIASEIRKGSKVCLVVWLKHEPKVGPTLNETEMPELPWHTANETIQRLKENRMLQ